MMELLVSSIVQVVPPVVNQTTFDQGTIQQNMIGFSVALGINAVTSIFAIVVFLINRGCVLPILICQSIGYKIYAKVFQRNNPNQFSLLKVSTDMIPKLIVLTLVVSFTVLRVASITIRMIDVGVYATLWSVISPATMLLFTVGMALNMTLFSSFLFLWFQLIHTINKVHKMVHPLGFGLAFVVVIIANLVCWVSMTACGIVFGLPPWIFPDYQQILLIIAVVIGTVHVFSIIMLDLIMLTSGIVIITVLAKSYSLQKNQLQQVNQEDQSKFRELNNKMKQISGLVARYLIVMIVSLFSINIIIIGFILLGAGLPPWVVVLLMQTIPECSSVVAMSIFFIPFFKISLENVQHIFQKFVVNGKGEKDCSQKPNEIVVEKGVAGGENQRNVEEAALTSSGSPSTNSPMNTSVVASHSPIFSLSSTQNGESIVSSAEEEHM